VPATVTKHVVRVAGAVRRFVREANGGMVALTEALRPWDDDGPLRWRAEYGGAILVGARLPDGADSGVAG
jgi:hypothetical protein